MISNRSILLISFCCKYITFCFTEHSRKSLEETVVYVDTDIDSPVSSTKSESDTNSSTTHHIETQRKDAQDRTLEDRRKSEMEISQTSNSGDDSPMEGTSVVHTKLPPGKVNILYVYDGCNNCLKSHVFHLDYEGMSNLY